MRNSLKKNLTLLLLLFIISFFSFYFLLDKFIKDKENFNLTIDYYFDQQALEFIVKEETKMKNAIIFINKFGYNHNEIMWKFPSDGKSYILQNLDNNIDLYDFMLRAISQENKIKLDKKSIENLLIHSKKIIDKSNFKLSIVFSFVDSSYAEIIFRNKDLIDEFFNEKFNKTLSEIIAYNNKVLFLYNQFLSELKINCDGFTKSNFNFNKNYLSDNFSKKYTDFINLENYFYGICYDESFQNFVPFDFTVLENDLLMPNNSETKINDLYLTYSEIQKTKLFNYILFIFMISLSFSIFLLMLINKLKTI